MDGTPVNWDGYEPYVPTLAAQPAACWGPSTLPRAQAKREFEKKLSERPGRHEMLRRLLWTNGGLELARSDGGILTLNDWFVGNVEADPDKSGSLLTLWYSVINDIALFLGDTLIERCPQLSWQLYSGQGVSHHKPVIMGFTRVPNRKYNIDMEGRVAGYAHSVIEHQGSVPRYGRVVVRNVELDLDRLLVEMPQPDIDTVAFLRWVKMAEVKA